MKSLREIYLGIVFVILMAGVAFFISSLDSVKSLNISPLVLGIVLGMILTNGVGSKLPSSLNSGILFSSKKILRFAITFYGFRITLSQIFDVGLEGFLFSSIMVLSTLLIGSFVGTKFFGLDRDTAILTASGASVCGAAAVVATEPVLKAEEHKVAVAVSMVVLFGTISMFLYPILWNYIFSKATDFFHLSSNSFGIYVGGTVHEVAQVVAITTMNGTDVPMAHSGVIVKLTRVLLIAPMLILLALYLKKVSIERSEESIKELTIPWFAIYFIFVVIFNSFELLPRTVVDGINLIDTFLLTMAMSALGLGSRFSNFKSLGVAPLYTALVMFIWLIVGGFLSLKFIEFLL